jgi:hypothetical protein
LTAGPRILSIVANAAEKWHFGLNGETGEGKRMDKALRLIRKHLKPGPAGQGLMIGNRQLHTAAPTDLDNDETRLGFRLPPLLKQIYLDIGNGGFGPGYGLIGMTGGEPDDTGKTAPEIYLQFQSVHIEEPEFCWPQSLLPICHWGCAILSCVSCDEQDYPMYIFDPNAHCDINSWNDTFFEEAPTFGAWIAAWARGVDLWQESYGPDGNVTKALERRKAGAMSPCRLFL